MSDIPVAPQGAPVVREDLRTTAIIVYALYLGAAISCGIAGIAGVIVAYVKRDDARGTIDALVLNARLLHTNC